eukprot:TRINITY_DN12076_c0_g1_i1.p3 TRINITY_DN12076_c0_g1~~TRINITY_DN12076_c0_g1_i1.p3  ORF type:complete len:156 (+),score=3.04 TRINITY_DN12076_c0_g1_i1:161-628(+)
MQIVGCKTKPKMVCVVLVVVSWQVENKQIHRITKRQKQSTLESFDIANLTVDAITLIILQFSHIFNCNQIFHQVQHVPLNVFLNLLEKLKYCRLLFFRSQIENIYKTFCQEILFDVILFQKFKYVNFTLLKFESLEELNSKGIQKQQFIMLKKKV